MVYQNKSDRPTAKTKSLYALKDVVYLDHLTSITPSLTQYLPSLAYTFYLHVSSYSLLFIKTA